MTENRGHTSGAVGGSDRAFGLVFAAFFALLGLYPLVKGATPRWWALALGALLLGAALALPRSLSSLNRLWVRLGLALNRVVSPAALFLVYWLAVVPTGLMLRVLRKDPLRMHADRNARTYWIEREPPGRASPQMKKQF